VRQSATIGAVLVLLTTPACAMQLTGCDTPPGFVSSTARADLPPPLQELFKDFAMPGGSFNEGDVGPLGQGVISIWHRGRRWILESGHGGIALSFDVVAFDVSDDGKAAVPLPPVTAMYCDAVRAYAKMH
jgi:hypothetical protein